MVRLSGTHSVSRKERAVGRRKTAAARVRLVPGTGTITVNGRALEAYFPTAILRQRVLSPLVVTGKEKDMDVSAKVAGGGMTGQAEAVRHGIARALVLLNADMQKILRAEGFLTRDPRAKERKKFGRHRARRGHQWRKR
jgi:small subunit ribosomal protein S9